MSEKTRTDEDKIAQAGIVVILGGKEYEIAPLVIRDSREWRKKVGPWRAEIARLASVDSDNTEEFVEALTELMVDRIDQTIEYFFGYAKDLNREEIEKVAIDREIVKSFNEVLKVAFPFE